MTSTIGYSAENRPIISYQFKDGPNKIIMVGGMHGGYEWNTILLAYELIDYFTQFPEQVPDSASLIIIPSANPDGQFAVVGENGRFTAEDIVDKSGRPPSRAESMATRLTSIAIGTASGRKMPSGGTNRLTLAPIPFLNQRQWRCETFY
ncbi:MAG: M14 family zinc carboxypeptidase [Chloroflexi bacterium]|nr:M14 family zinc carboxypeptidase [Chloroflexota bacterium]